MKYIVAFVLTLYSYDSFAETFADALVRAAMERTTHSVRYDGGYYRIDYPNGDVPSNIGVCTDVVIRSYRTLGIDLQALVHKDMRNNFSAYPSKRIWGLTRPDTNIDHRRVPNLQTFFKRHGKTLPITQDPSSYKAGDIVTWMLPKTWYNSSNRPHIGIVVEKRSWNNQRPLIVHNIGFGPKVDDVLFDYPITGHYRYTPK